LSGFAVESVAAFTILLFIPWRCGSVAGGTRNSAAFVIPHNSSRERGTFTDFGGFSVPPLLQVQFRKSPKQTESPPGRASGLSL
jgi:hypothetical protein